MHGLIQSLKRLTYPKFEVLLLEDHSSDETLPLLLEETKGLPNFHVIKGKSLPNNWIGKVFGCHQLSKKASGEYLLFIDADVRLEPNTIEATLTFAQNKGAALVTGFPRFPTNTFLGNLVIPLQHFVVLFHLPLLIANHSQKASFSAAHGAFMFFSKEGYLKIGGHEAVKGSLVEDVEITRAVKKAGIRAVLANTTDYVTCYMYETSKEVWDGFTKNIFPGLGRSYLLAVFINLFYSIFYVLPLPLALTGIIFQNWFFVIPLVITVLQRLVIDYITKQRMPLFLFMPISAIGLILLITSSMIRSWKKQGYTWKGRNYS